MTKYEKIKSMSVDEMAEFLVDTIFLHLSEYNKQLGLAEINLTDEEKQKPIDAWKQCLEQEED
jgi:hypothetical protein